jgi:hypothetical protein
MLLLDTPVCLIHDEMSDCMIYIEVASEGQEITPVDGLRVAGKPSA